MYFAEFTWKGTTVLVSCSQNARGTLSNEMMLLSATPPRIVGLNWKEVWQKMRGAKKIFFKDKTQNSDTQEDLVEDNFVY